MEDNQNFTKMMEQAMAISNAMNNNADEKQEGFENDIEEKIRLASEMAQMFSLMKDFSQKSEDNTRDDSSNSTHIPEEKHEKKINTQPKNENIGSFFDESILTPQLKTIKASIPYLEERYKKPISLYVKFLEMKKVMEMYSPDVEIASFEKTQKNPYWKKDMIRAVKTHLTGPKKDMANLLLKALEMEEILKRVKGVNNKWQ